MPNDIQRPAELEIKPTAAMGIRTVVVIGSAAFLAIFLAYLLSGGGSDLFAQRTTITTYMPDGTGLSATSEVRLSGIRIGMVDRVEFSGLLDPQRAIRVKIRIPKRYLKNIPADSQTDIGLDTIVGFAFVGIDAGKSPVPVGEDGVLQSEPLKEATARADQMRVVEDNLTAIDRLLIEASSSETDLGRFMLRSEGYDTMLSGIGDFDRSLHTFITPQSRAGQAFFSLDMYNRIHNAVTEIDATLESIQNGEGAAGRLFTSDGRYDDIVRQLSDLRATLAEANAGKGRAGAMLHDDESYRRLRRMLSATDSMLTSLNAGEGRAGELLANPQLYESLNGSLRGIEERLRDLREHPKKYLRAKVF